MAEPTHASPALERDVLREIPLSRIVVPEGFNPRGEIVDDAELDALAQTIRRHGVLQPVRVRARDTGDFVLIAGERRYRAAVKAALTVLPAIVRAAGAGDEAEEAELAAEAVIENELRKQLDPVQRALGYRRMMLAGLTVKGVAQRLGGIPSKRVRETLAILDLPSELWPQVADGAIPLRAVKPLVALSKVHSGLPAVAVQRVLGEPVHSWDAPTTWDDLAANPVAILTGGYDQQLADLPDDVFVAGHGYPVGRFRLDPKTQRQLSKLCELLPGIEPDGFQVRFERELVEQAAALGAAHASTDGHEALIVGADVARQLATDYIAASLKTQRAIASRDRAATVADDAGGVEAEQPVSEDDRKEHARREREADRRRKEAALAHNELLGAAIVKHLAKLKTSDERVLKILTAAPLADELARIAARGARLGFPGWIEREQRKNGTTKVTYLQTFAAEAKAREFLAGAHGAAEIAGRSVALLAMARWADETAIPASQASGYQLRFAGYGAGDHGVPWRTEADDLLCELVLEKLPPEPAEPIRQAKEQRDRERAEEQRRARERDAVVAAFMERAAGLTRDERHAEIQRLRREYGYTAIPQERGRELMELPEPEHGAAPERD